MDDGESIHFARLLVDFLAAGPSLGVSAGSARSRLFEALRACAGARGICTAQELADVVSVHKTTAREWLLGRKLPEMGQLLRLLAFFGMGLPEFLSGKLPEPLTQIGPPVPPRQKKWTRQPFVEDSVRPVLEAALEAGDDACPPTVRAICQKHGWVYDTVHQHLPQLCHRLSAIRAAWRQHQKRQRHDRVREEIREAALRVHQSDHPVTVASVGAVLKKAGVLRSLVARAALKEILLELYPRPCI